MQTQEIAEKLLPMYLGVENKYKKDYSYISERRQLELLKERRGYEKSRPTLGRYKHRLDDEGYISRIQRFIDDPVYGMIFKSTVVYITIKGLHWLRRAGHDVTAKIYRALIRMKKKAPGPYAPAPKKVSESSKSQPKTMGGFFQNLGFVDGDELERIGIEAYLRKTNT